MVFIPAALGVLAGIWYYYGGRVQDIQTVITGMVRSDTAKKLGVDNSPHGADLARVTVTARDIGLPVLSWFPESVITSGYRSQAVNSALTGAVANSKHTHGDAIDFRPPPGVSSAQFMAAIVRKGLKFDKLIAYSTERGGHIHISHTPGNNRNLLMVAPSSGGYESVSLSTIPERVR